MNASLVDQVVNSVLYEGYILYPYRSSSIKNRSRFTFGRVYPEAFSISQNGAEPFIMQTECLVHSTGAPLVQVEVRFLHPLAREIGLLEPKAGEHSRDAIRSPCQELRVDGRLYQTWQEAVERTIVMLRSQSGHSLSVRWSCRLRFRLRAQANRSAMTRATSSG